MRKLALTIAVLASIGTATMSRPAAAFDCWISGWGERNGEVWVSKSCSMFYGAPVYSLGWRPIRDWW